MSRLRIAFLFCAVAALLIAAGCGDDDDSDDTTTAAAENCTPEDLQTISDGKLTVATDSPAFPPYFVDDDPTNGKGFESAVAYAIADRLGYDEADVEWVVEPFNSSYAPGPKDFDFDVNQISITPKRAEQVDFSSPYYEAEQAVVALKDSDAAGATSLADLAGRVDRRPDRDDEPRRGQTPRSSRARSRRSSTRPTTSSRRSSRARSTRSSSTSRRRTS